MAADLPTRTDYLALARDHVTSSNPRLDPEQIDIEGSDVNVIVGPSTVIAAHATQHLGYRIAAHYLGSAELEDLDRWLIDHYDLARKGAGAGLGTVVFSRPTAGAGAGVVGAGTKLRSQTGAEYVTLSDATFGVADLTSGSVSIRAVQAGPAGRAGTAEVNQIVNPGVLFDATLTVANPDPVAGADPREGDNLYRERGRGFWRAARRGTLAAIRQGGLDTIGVASALAAEVTLGSIPQRAVLLFIADESGLSNIALANAVDANLDEYRAAGINVLPVVGLVQLVTIKLHLTFSASVATEAITQNIIAAIIEFVNSLGVNEPLTLAALNAVLLRFVADGLIVNSSTITEPLGDLVPEPGRTIRTQVGLVTAA